MYNMEGILTTVCRYVVPDGFWQVIGWLLIALAVSPIVLGLGGPAWQGLIRPRLIPQGEIDQLADETMADYPDDPEGAAFREEEYHWHRSEEFEQGKWRRVRREIQRRLPQTG